MLEMLSILHRRNDKEKYCMISNQILQNTIEGLKGIARVELCVMDVEGKIEYSPWFFNS